MIELEQRSRRPTYTHDAPRGVNQQALVVGDPDFSGWTKVDGKNLEPLKGAKKEAKTVDTELEDSHAVELLRSKEATKEAVLGHMLKSDVVHLATHGAPDAVFFAGESEEAATLSMAEVQQERMMISKANQSQIATLTFHGTLQVKMIS